MIILITGQPRHGKSQYAVSLIFDYLEKNNQKADKGGEPLPIYTDINGINEPETITKLDGVFKVPDKKFWFGHEEECPEGYYMPPAGSIFIFDECHKLEWVKASRGQVSQDPTTISLNEHGHFDYVIIFMTQFPKYIHPHIQGLVETHYHVKRPHGAKFAYIYEFDEFISNPRTEAAFKNAVGKVKFAYKDKYQNAYKSASSHNTMRFRFPQKLVFPLIFFACLIALLVWRFFNSPIGEMIRGKEKEPVATVTTQQQQNQPVPASYTIPDVKPKPPKEVLRQQYLPENVYLTAYDEDIRPAMVITEYNQTGSACRAFNSRGERLVIADSTCNLMNNRPAFIPRSREENNHHLLQRDEYANEINPLDNKEPA